MIARSVCRSEKAVQVLDAARALFVAEGFGATNMDAIASAAGVSKATIYAHYDGKESLFAAVVERECERTKARMAIHAGAGAPVRTLAAVLTDFGHQFVETLGDPEIAGLARMVVAESRRFPELGRIYYDSAPGRMQADLTQRLARACERGQMADTDIETAAEQFLSMLRGDRYIRLLLGLAPVPGDGRRAVEAAVATVMARYGTPG